MWLGSNNESLALFWSISLNLILYFVTKKELVLYSILRSVAIGFLPVSISVEILWRMLANFHQIKTLFVKGLCSQFHQHFAQIFHTKVFWAAFFYLHVTREKLPKRRLYQKCASKTLMKLTIGERFGKYVDHSPIVSKRTFYYHKD